MGLKLFRMTVSGVILSLALFSCSNENSASTKNNNSANNTTVIKSQWTPKSGTQATVRVIDENDKPIVNASVLVGQELNNPFADNLIKTNKDGVAVIPAAWTSEAAVTVDAAKYVRQTLLDLPPGDLTIRMSLAADASPTTLQGEITGLPVVNGDKQIDFALVMPAFSRLDMLNFSLDLAISPITETISVANRNVETPSNLSLPTQSERYLLFNVTLSKPTYHLTVPYKGRKTFYAASGRFPFKPVVDGLNNNQSFYDLINQFSITGGSLRDADLNSSTVNLNIPSAELTFSGSVNVKPPSFKNDEALVIVSTSEVAKSLVPTDIKRATSGQTIQLNTMAGKPVYVVSALKRQSEMNIDAVGADRLSASILPSDKYSSTLLPLIENPSVRQNNGFELTLPNQPTLPAKLNPLATTVVISDVVQTDAKTKNYIRRWEIAALKWKNKIQLPNFPLNDMQSRKKVEVNYIASASTSSVRLDDDIIKSTTHVTHASTEF